MILVRETVVFRDEVRYERTVRKDECSHRAGSSIDRNDPAEAERNTRNAASERADESARFAEHFQLFRCFLRLLLSTAGGACHANEYCPV
ncbi:MAG: hypothetical protein ACYC9S_14145 [Leptospirales bacterium]